MFSRRAKAAIAGCGVIAALLPVTAGQASVNAVTVLDLQLNELPGATVAEDTSGYGHHGQIGQYVQMKTEPDLTPNAPAPTVSFADWPRRPPDAGIYYGLDHLIAIPDAADHSLDPGAGDFTVEFRFRTKEKFGNILQKGQARTVGGQVKFQIPKGKLGCMFRTPEGMATATTGAWLVNDNQWHVARCERTPSAVTLYIDGQLAGRKRGFTGELNNKKPWTIGGKLECDAVNVTCDYFAGEIDYVRMWKG